MKVLNLRCQNGHGFEGWFASDDDFMSQNGGDLIECPLCSDRVITRLPSAPRLNLSGAREPVVPAPKAEPVREMMSDEVQVGWLAAVRHLLANTEDVGPRFADEARRIHYGEAPERAIRGAATPEQRESLQEEGIEVVSIPVPQALKGPVQ